VILYELLTGQLPFQGSVASIIGQILAKEPIPPTKIRPEISPRLEDICLKAMAKQVEDRYLSMKELANVLGEFLKSKAEEGAEKSRDKDKETGKPRGREKQREAPQKKEQDAVSSNLGKGSPERSQPEKSRSEKSRSEKSQSDKTATDAGQEQSAGGVAAEAVPGVNLLSLELEVTCRCGQRMVAKSPMAGKMVRCPRCADIVQIPGTRSTTRQHKISCASCGQQFLARDELVGRAVKCPVCGKPMTVPRPGVSAAATPQIEVSCVCGQQFLARPDLAGKRVRCTSCGRPLAIPRA
jgi:serine/threonine protein kinase